MHTQNTRMEGQPPWRGGGRAGEVWYPLAPPTMSVHLGVQVLLTSVGFARAEGVTHVHLEGLVFDLRGDGGEDGEGTVTVKEVSATGLHCK